MLRVVRCIPHRYCHHCDCHYQKSCCQIHFFCCLQSYHHPILHYPILYYKIYTIIPKAVNLHREIISQHRLDTVTHLGQVTNFDLFGATWASDGIQKDQKLPIALIIQSSSNSILSCNVYFAASAENRCGRNVSCGGGGGWGSVSLLHTKFCVIVDFCFAGFISLSGNCFLLNHKVTSCPLWSTRVNLCKSAVLAILVLIISKVSS